MPRPSESARNRSLPPQTGGDGRTPAGLERLREHIRRIEGYGGTLSQGNAVGGNAVGGNAVGGNASVLPFGIEEIDSRLPGGGLLRGALHEVFAADAGIATAFCALIAGRLSRDGGAILWCERPRILDAGALYGPALPAFGIDPARLILVRARKDTDVLWAMEEGLRCARIAAVIGEAAEISLTASRRLQLAAAESGVTALALRPATRGVDGTMGKPQPSAAATRWRLSAMGEESDDAPSAGRNGRNAGFSEDLTTRPGSGADQNPGPGPGLGAARWQVELFRCRGGATANWMMEWSDETGDFSVAAVVRDRQAVPPAARLAG